MKTIIIGAGAAGLMTAAALLEANPQADVTLVERNNGLGKKVIISGGGRCNVTTGIRDVRTLLTKYPRGNKFLSKAMYAFPPEAVYDWFEAHGVPLKTEKDLRVFPQSNDGKDVVGAFERLFASRQVRILLNTAVVRVARAGEGFEVFVKNQDAPLQADCLVLTTGGQAYRHTGSTGDGYAFAQALGHTITPLAPSLNAFFTRETWPAELSGLSFEKATITALRGKHPSFTGPFLFTHKGVSGPAVFALSSIVAFERYDAIQPLEITIDLFPDESVEVLRSRIEAVCSTETKKLAMNVLGSIVPKSLAVVLCREAQLASDKRAGEVHKKDAERLAAWLKAIPLNVIQRGAGDEFVTAGGVATAEVDPATMESKICPGLYLAGEILDVDGFTGGFNLQASWAAGHLAGESIASSERS